jgi:hypothetical protein
MTADSQVFIRILPRIDVSLTVQVHPDTPKYIQ